VEPRKWFSLIDKVYSLANLESAATEVARNGGAAGVDRVTTEMFLDRKEANLTRLSEALQTGTYKPQAVMRTWIPKPGTREQRPLGIPTVSDRVVQNALRHVLEPIFERDFAEHSYGFRPGRSCIDALARVEALLEALAERLLCGAWVVQPGTSPCFCQSIRSAVNHQPESRMRENRPYGSEGGETGNSTGLSYPSRED